MSIWYTGGPSITDISSTADRFARNKDDIYLQLTHMVLVKELETRRGIRNGKRPITQSARKFSRIQHFGEIFN